eukprot:jgi/Tetstr1/454081/TSEL_041000.t1
MAPPKNVLTLTEVVLLSIVWASTSYVWNVVLKDGLGFVFGLLGLSPYLTNVLVGIFLLGMTFAMVFLFANVNIGYTGVFQLTDDAPGFVGGGAQGAWKPPSPSPPPGAAASAGGLPPGVASAPPGGGAPGPPLPMAGAGAGAGAGPPLPIAGPGAGARAASAPPPRATGAVEAFAPVAF